MRVFPKLALAALAVVLAGADRPAAGPGDSRTRALSLFLAIENGASDFGGHASNLGTYRRTLERVSEVRALRQLGAAAAEVAREKLRQPPAEREDNVIAVAAYLLEQQGIAAAIPELEAYLRGNPGSRGVVWAAHGAVRALLVLKKLPDPGGGYEEYREDDFRRTLAATAP